MKKILPLISLLLLCNLTAFADMISSEVCEIQCTSENSKPWFSLETDDNGDLLFSIAGDATEVGLKFRGNPFKRGDTQFTVDGAAASGYFDLDASDYTTSDKLVIRVPLKSGVSVTANAKINLVCTLEWWSSLNTNAYTTKTFPEYTYGTICCLSGKELKATVTDIRKTIATVDVYNKCLVMEGSEYEYRLGYKESTESSYTYIEGFQSTYNLSGLTMGTAYNISFEAATPSFSNPTKSYSATANFTTKDNQSTACDVPVTSAQCEGECSVGKFSLVTNGVTGNMEMLIGGDETDYQFRETPGLSSFLVNGGSSAAYFDAPYLSDNDTKVIIPLKSGSSIADDDLVTFSGTLAWKSSLFGNAYRFDQSFSTLYNTSCCVEGQQLTATVADVQTNSAQISLADNCITGQGYQYRLRYKLSDATEYQTIYAEGYARPEGGVYNLSSLLSDETYVAIAEAAYPDFTSSTKPLEQSAVNFTTAAKGATSCELPYSSGESNMTISMETIDGDIIISINGDETEVGLRFRDEWITKDITRYTVNGEAASNYFSAPSLNSDMTVVTLKNIAAVPDNAEIKYTGTISWWSSKNDNAYVENKTITHTYGTVCCAAGNRLKIASPVVSTTSATIAVSDACISGEGYAERLKYRRSGTSDEYTIASDPVNNVYTLSNLISATSYDVIFEAAYPAFGDDPLIYEKAETSFTTEPKCSDPCWQTTLQSGSSEASFRLALMTNGDVRLIMNCDETNAMLRGEMPNYLTRLKVNGVDGSGSTYFNEPVMSGDKQYVTYTVKSALPDNSTVAYDGAFEWKSDLNGDAWNNGKITIPYSRLTAPTIVAQETSATVTFGDALFSGEGYKYRLQYKRSVDADYTSLPVSESNVIVLSNILSGDDYDIITEIAYPSFENADKIYESASASFSTITKCANNCTNQFTMDGSTVNIKMATRVNGDILITIDSDEERPRFRPEGLAVNIDLYDVNDEDASNYFNAPVMAADSSTITLTKKAELPKDAVIYFKGLISWATKPHPNCWLNGQQLSYTYNRIYISDIDAETNSATVTVNDAAFSGEGYAERVKYRLSGSSEDYTIAEQEGGVYLLSSLLNNTEYEVIAEAAYPSFDQQDVYEYSSSTFTTASVASEVCSVEIKGNGTTCEISMESVPNGDLVVSIGGTYTFHDEGITKEISNYFVNGLAASDYFDAPVLAADKKSATLKTKGNVPENAIITFNGTIAWYPATGQDYKMGCSLTHTYGTWCCDVAGFKITRCEALSNSTAIVEINNLCIADKPYQYTYSLKEGEGEFGEATAFSGLTINLSELKSSTTYTVKVEATMDEITKTQTASFTTTALAPAPVPTYASDLVTTVYSSTYGRLNLNYTYSYTENNTPKDFVLTSESTLMQCDMKLDKGNEPQNAVFMTFPTTLDLTGRDMLHFDVFISSTDKAKSGYIGVKLRNNGGVFNDWVPAGELTADDWTRVDIPVSSFTGLDITKASVMSIIPSTDNSGSTEGSPFSTESFTIYIDNIFFYTPGVARIGSTYYNTLGAAITAAQDNQEVELLGDVTEDVTIEGKTIEFDANSHSIGDLTIGLGADVTLTGDLEIGGDFTLKTGTASTGSFDVSDYSVSLTGDAFYSKKLYETGASRWYGFSLPFNTAFDGITNASTGEGFDIEQNIAFNVFNSQFAANGVASAWTHIEDDTYEFASGTLYLVALRYYNKVNELSFQAVSDSKPFDSSTTIDLTYYTGTGAEKNWGWNGIGNNQLYKARISAEGMTYGLVFNGEGYTTITLASQTLNPGDALFLQTDADKDATLTKVGGVTKSAEEAAAPAQIRISGVGSDVYDQCFITASESASESYQIGKDLQKMAGFKYYSYPTIWLNNYSTELAAIDVKTVDGEAEVSLGINAPKAGNYVISPVSMGDVETLQLTRNGEVIWDFADGDVTLALTKGENSGYALKIGVEEGVATGADEADADINACKAVKYIENGRIIIEVNGERYNLSGIKIK